MEAKLPKNVKRVTPQSKASSQRRLVRQYCKSSRRNLGLSKTRLARFIAETNSICKRDIILVLRKIKFNESFDVLGTNFSMAASTAFHIFKRRVKQLAGQVARFIDWHDGSTIYKQYNPRGAEEHLISMVDHLVIDHKLKYFISCSVFGLINFLSKGYPYKMSNRKMVEQSNFPYELPRNSNVMGPNKYKLLGEVLCNQSLYYMWETFDETLAINYCQMAPANRWVKKPMILQVKRELRRFKILSGSNLDPKLLPILDEVMVICAALCNLRKNWLGFLQPCDVDVDQEHVNAAGNEMVGETEDVDIEEYEAELEEECEDEMLEEEYIEQFEEVLLS